MIKYHVSVEKRYLVTRAEVTENTGSTETIGHYTDEETAVEVAYALAEQERKRLGYSLGDERIQFPAPLGLTEQLQTPDPQSSEGESAEAVRPFATHLSQDGVPHWEDMTSEQIKAHKAAANGTHPEQQD